MQQVIADGNRDGEFCAFLGFEWHSSRWGDQCVVFPGDHRPLFYTDDPHRLRRFCVEERALMIPHHLAYPSGHRGVNWEAFDEDCTPVVEIYSEHGNGEDDRGPLTYFSHSMGGRADVEHGARRRCRPGLRFGFVGSSDDHAGFPGAYGEGLMAALVADFTREGIFEAIRARRTYALTGDRIEVDFAVDGAPMGATIEAGTQVEVAFAVRGRDELDVVEIIQDGARRAPGVRRRTGGARRCVRRAGAGAPRMGLGPVGRAGARPHLRLGDAGRRAAGPARCASSPACSRCPSTSGGGTASSATATRALAIRSYTARQSAYRENPNQSVVLELDGGCRTRARRST